MSDWRSKSFLAVACGFATLLFLVGTWEWVVAGAVHQLVLSGVTLALTAIAWRLHRRNCNDQAQKPKSTPFSRSTTAGQATGPRQNRRGR